MNREIHEEVLLIPPENLIASVGGSLGLFFGFSFSDTIFYYISKLFK